jgi:hypothetical protein
MKTLLTLFVTLLASQSALAGTGFTCKTTTREGYYVKTTMNLEIKDQRTVFAVPFDADGNEWNKGSVGTLSATKADGTAAFKGFDSEQMFGDLSEGFANNIYLYVSSDVMSGKNGWVSLYASGSEVGLEKGTYSCVRR